MIWASAVVNPLLTGDTVWSGMNNPDNGNNKISTSGKMCFRKLLHPLLEKAWFQHLTLSQSLKCARERECIKRSLRNLYLKPEINPESDIDTGIQNVNWEAENRREIRARSSQTETQRRPDWETSLNHKNGRNYSVGMVARERFELSSAGPKPAMLVHYNRRKGVLSSTGLSRATELNVLSSL